MEPYEVEVLSSFFVQLLQEHSVPCPVSTVPPRTIHQNKGPYCTGDGGRQETTNQPFQSSPRPGWTNPNTVLRAAAFSKPGLALLASNTCCQVPQIEWIDKIVEAQVFSSAPFASLCPERTLSFENWLG